MTDIKTLALKYGGYTSLDKVYLDQLLACKTEQEQLALITPPPSVVNAYFAELYQKKSPARIFSENEEVISEDLLFEIAQIFPHQLVFEESGNIYMKAVGDEKVVSVESLTALTDLESLADGRKRLKGYSQEDLLQEATAFSGKRYFRSENGGWPAL